MHTESLQWASASHCSDNIDSAASGLGHVKHVDQRKVGSGGVGVIIVGAVVGTGSEVVDEAVDGAVVSGVSVSVSPTLTHSAMCRSLIEDDIMRNKHMAQLIEHMVVGPCIPQEDTLLRSIS